MDIGARAVIAVRRVRVVGLGLLWDGMSGFAVFIAGASLGTGCRCPLAVCRSQDDQGYADDNKGSPRPAVLRVEPHYGMPAPP